MRKWLKDLVDTKIFQMDLDRWSRSIALNIGLEKAIYDYACFIDGDCVLDPDCLRNLSAFLDKETVFVFDVRKTDDITQEELWKNSELYKYGVGISAGPRGVYQAIGGFDERMWGWGCEDVDLIQRLYLYGTKLKPIYPYSIVYKKFHSRQKINFSSNTKHIDGQIHKSPYHVNRNVIQIL